MKQLLEICVDSINSVINAIAGGAQRYELCANLREGGTTPSAGLIAAAGSIMSIPGNVLIRPRAGDFIYNSREVDVMLRDIEFVRRSGMNGIVIGALTPKGDVDLAITALLMEAAGDLDVTFHRAFDLTEDPIKAMEQIIELGCHRILTSGQAATAAEGVSLIKRLIKKANGQIIIMPGAGINADNIIDIAKGTGATEFHMSARTIRTTAGETPARPASMGVDSNDTMNWLECDPIIVSTVSEKLNNHFRS